MADASLSRWEMSHEKVCGLLNYINRCRTHEIKLNRNDPKIPRNVVGPLTNPEVLAQIREYAKTHTTKECAVRFDVTEVYLRLYRIKGIRVWQNRINKIKVTYFHHLSGKTYREIGAILWVTHQRVEQIINYVNQQWKYSPEKYQARKKRKQKESRKVYTGE